MAGEGGCGSRHPFLRGMAWGAACALLFTAVAVQALSPSAPVDPGGPSAAVPAISAVSDVVDEDPTLAEAVSAKCLPSVVSIVADVGGKGSAGSGIVMDAEGHVLTNDHVVDGASSVTVTMDGTDRVPAEVVGADASSDLAVLRFDPGDRELVPMEVGDSSSLAVGEWVMAIGSPFGLDRSVSTGIVSSLCRSTILTGYSGNNIYTNMIQTDAAINPGNSGGALVDSEGRLVGVNSIIQSYSGSSSGVGFAIPSDYAMGVAASLAAGEPVEHASLGVNVLTVTGDLARSRSLAVSSGAYVTRVAPGGAAEAAGLEPGDVVVSVSGEPVASADALILAVRSRAVGDPVEVGYARGGDRLSATVALGSDVSGAATDALDGDPVSISPVG